MSVNIRDRFTQIRGELGDLRDQRARAKEMVKLARQQDDSHAVAAAEIKLESLGTEIELRQEVERQLLRQVSGLDRTAFGETVFTDPSAITALEGVAATSAPIGNMLIGRVLDAEQLAASFGRRPSFASTGGGDLLVPDSGRQQPPYGVVGQLYQQTALLNLIPTAVMTGGSFTYLIEAGSIDDQIPGSPEGAIKPEETSLELDEGEVRAVTIAAWRKLRRQTVADVPELQNLVNNRLRYSVQRRIEAQVLAGTGQNETLTGILSTTGVGTVPYEAATPAADLILSGLTVVRVSGGNPTGIVLNPVTYQQMLQQKAEGSGERLDSAGAFAGTVDSLWGVPVVQSPVISPDRALVGDWAAAARLFIREGLSLRLSDSDQDDFIRNRLTALTEARVGLAVFQPSAVCEVELAGA